MKFIFLPVFGQTTRWCPSGVASNQFLGKTKTRSAYQKLQLLNWMDEELKNDAATYYPHALVSYYYYRRIPLYIPKGAYIFGDSGGFSLMQRADDMSASALRHYFDRNESLRLPRRRSTLGGAHHQRLPDAAEVIRWQEELCTVGALLDRPPVDKKGNRVWSTALSRTVQNTEKALDVYLRMLERETNFHWWGVVHGWTHEHLETWWDAISRVYPFERDGEGWAFKARDPSWNPAAIAYCLHYIKRKGLKRVHFLAAASPTAVATMLALGQEANIDLLTADSITADRMGRSREIFIPEPADAPLFKRLKEQEHSDDRVAKKYMQHTCQCYSCQQLRSDLEQWSAIIRPEERLNEYWCFRYIFHNQIAIKRMVENQQQLAKKNPEELLKRAFDARFTDAEGDEQITEGKAAYKRSQAEKKAKRNYIETMRAFEDGEYPKAQQRGMPRSMLDFIDHDD